MRSVLIPSLAALAGVAASVESAWADVGVYLEPSDVWSAWSFDPLILFVLVTIGCLYHRGRRELQRRSVRLDRPRRYRAVSFYAGLVVIALASLSPLDALGSVLASAHMAQHVLLMLLAAPLLVLGAPTLAITYAVPRNWHHAIGLKLLSHRLTWHPGAVWLLFAVTLWGWHHPLLYHAALRDQLVHDAQHLSFFVAAFLYWRVVLDPTSRRRLHPIAAVPFLFTTSLHEAALGAFLALAPAPWYYDYAGRTAAFGFTPLADQQLAGLLMWAPACLVYPIVATVLAGRWLIHSEPQRPATLHGPPTPHRNRSQTAAAAL